MVCGSWADDRGEDLVHLGLTLSGLAAMLQASGFDGAAFGLLWFQQDGLTSLEVGVGPHQLADAPVVPEVVVMGNEVGDLVLNITVFYRTRWCRHR